MKHIVRLTKKDFRIDYFRPSGNGGQKMRKTESGVRITHLESGAVGLSTDTRSRHENQKIAFVRMTKHHRFQMWLGQFRDSTEVASPSRRYTYKAPDISLERRKQDRD